MRPYWKGYLKLALVSCPIALHAACSTSERIAFRQINKVGMRSRSPAQGSHSLRLRPEVESDGTLADFSAIGRPFFGCLTEVIPYEHARICVLGRRL